MQLISCIDKNFALALNLKNQAAKLSKASSSLLACFCCPAGRRFPFSQTKRKSCLKVTLKSIRRISRAWSTHFDPALASTNQRKGGIHKGGKEFSFSLPCAGRGSVRAATAGTVAPSHPLLTFGKLTTKFE